MKKAVFLFITIIFCIAGICLYVSFFSYPHLKSLMDNISPDKNYRIFDQIFYHKLIIFLRAFAIACSFLGALTYYRRKIIILKTDYLINKLKQDSPIFFSDISKSLRKYYFEISGDRLYLTSFLIIFSGAVLYRAYFVTIKPMGYDETFSYLYFSQKTLTDLMTDYHNTINHIFLNILSYCSAKIFGMHPWAIRLPVFLFGILSLILSYITTRVIFNKTAALLSLALVGISGVLVNYSANARGYIVVTDFFLLTFLLGRYLIRKDSIIAWILLILFFVIELYTLPSAFYVVFSLCLWLFLSAKFMKTGILKARFIFNLGKSFLSAIFVSLLLYLPILLRVGFNLTKIGLLKQASPLSYKVFLPRMFFDFLPQCWKFINLGLPNFILWICLSGIVIALIFHRRISSERYSILMVSLFSTLMLIFFLRSFPPDRAFTPYAAVYLITSGGGLSFIFDYIKRMLNSERLKLFFYSFIILIFLGGIVPVIKNPKLIYYDGRIVEARKFMPFLKKNLNPNDKLLLGSAIGWFDATVFEYYLRLYGLEAWCFGNQGYFDLIKNDDFLGNVYIITIDNKDNCNKYYHCENSYNIDSLMPMINKERYFKPLEIARFDYTSIYILRPIKK